MSVQKDNEYSNLTLDELRELLWRTDQKYEAEVYDSIFREIERHLESPTAQVARGPWREWVFERPQTPRNFPSIIKWWESRRGFYNSFVFCVFLSSLLSTACLMGLSSLRGEAFQLGLGWFWLPLLGAFGILILQVSIMILANILFCCAWIIDGLISIPLRIFGWRTSVALFTFTLVVTILSAAIPPLIVLRDILLT